MLSNMNNFLLNEFGKNGDDNIQHDEKQPGVLLPDGKTHLRGDGSGVDIRHEGIMITPTPGFVLKTKVNQPNNETKAFINVCYHDDIELPSQKKKLDDEGNEVEGLNVPLSMSPIRTCSDKSNMTCLVVDAIMNTSVKDEIQKDTATGGAYRDFVCMILIQFFEQKFTNHTPLDRQYKLPRLSYFGYVDVNTGQVVRKKSEQTQVLRQNIRNRKKGPKIEEVTTNVSNNQQPRTLIASHNDITSTLKSCRDLITPKYDVVVTLSSGDVMSVDQLVDIVNNYASSSTSNELQSSITQKKDNLPLLLNSKINASMKVESVSVTVNLPKFHANETKVEFSAYILYLSGTNIQETKIVFPLCINPNTLKAIYDEESCTLKIEANISCIKMEDEPDVGSQPWILARALGGNNSKATKGKHDSKKKNDDQDTTSKDMSQDALDPYHTRPLYLKASDLVTKPISTSTFRPNNNAETTIEEVPLPEDSFHTKDSLSQHWLLEQEREQKERHDKKKEEREEARKSNDSVEFVDTDDFKPGGKYYMNNNKNEAKKDEISSLDEDESRKVLRKAEAFLRENYEATLTHSMWSNLF